MGPNDSGEVIGRVTETKYDPCEGFSFNIAVPRKGGKMEELRKVLPWACDNCLLDGRN